MNPRFVAVAGPLTGAVFPLTEAETVIGREASNRIPITDISVSRRHCVIKREAEQFKLSDVDSLNGTFVNDVPVKERLLKEGDRIRIGDTLFLFLLEEDDALQPASLQFDDTHVMHTATVRLRLEDALYLMARDLSALMKISTTINSLRSMDALQHRLLELIFEVVPAEHGAVLLVEEGQEDFATHFGWERGAGGAEQVGQPVRVSRTIARQVLQEGVALLSNDVSESEAFRATTSLIASQTRSLLCVPLQIFEKVLGVIYLDTRDPKARFDEDHLQLLTAIANIAAAAIENVRHLEWLEGENRRLHTEIKIEHNMVGESRRMHDVYQFIARVAPTDSTVLIGGESGTGKELAAHAIHLNSPRAGKAFVAINCAALTETLLESELFGHERGAFTGAVVQKKGKLEVADGGSIFLDEVAELAPTLQAKLLRVLQEREFERVGGTRSIKVNIRLIAATNKDLEERVKDGSFRQDLYYRLNVVRLMMPPLRERREDISLLASYFTAKCSQKCKRKVSGISAEARAYLMSYDWPGNVRELENAIERAVVLGSSDFIRPEDLPEAVLEGEPSTDVAVTKYHEAIKQAKKQLILKAVEEAHGNYTEAAKLLGVHPNYLHRLIRNLNLRAAVKK
ncbi:MAG: sigma 54-interacting transcriptional regulator [Pyrinomonadaceae bacterium]|nr:sigma 54-interacting transcriptional regulator [Pyrinomonadaceae bacterium]